MRNHSVPGMPVVATLVAASLLTGCFGSQAAPDGRDAPHVTESLDRLAPEPEALANGTYKLAEPAGTVTLTNGEWTDSSTDASLRLLGQARAVGDLDGDGNEEAGALLSYRRDGVETLYLVVVAVRDGMTHMVAQSTIGTGIELRDAVVEDDHLILRLYRHAQGDQPCCPGEAARLVYRLEGTRIALIDSQVSRRALSDLEGSRWRLAAFDGETVPADAPAVTLGMEDGRFVGTGGCNQYSTGLESGSLPGEVRTSGVVSTRMACPDPAGALETRYLAALERVRGWSFDRGSLVLTWNDENQASHRLVFAPETPPTPPRPNTAS